MLKKPLGTSSHLYLKFVLKKAKSAAMLVFLQLFILIALFGQSAAQDSDPTTQQMRGAHSSQ